MARPLRIEYPGAYYHITTRGVGRQDIFLDEMDKQMFLGKVKDVHEKWGLVVHGYCLMSNHYHLEVEIPEGNLSRPMQLLNHVYAGYINMKYKRAGHLFQGRFKSVLIEADTHLHVLTRYIHLNPVRAGMVKHPVEYKWSSYREYLGMRKCQKWLDVKQTLERFGRSEKEQRSEYRKFVEEGVAENPLREMVFGAFLGTTQFVDRVRRKLNERKEMKKDAEISGMIYARPHLEIDGISEVVSRVYGIGKGELRIKGRKGNESRDVAIYLSKKYSKKTNEEIGEYFGGIRPSAVSLGSGRTMKRMKTDRRFLKKIRQLEDDVANLIY
jgi:putative transposase